MRRATMAAVLAALLLPAPAAAFSPGAPGAGDPFFPLAGNGAFVVNEPQGSPSWYPANDTPKDKATYDFTITVPKGITAIGNGLLVSRTDNGDTTTWRWRASDPTAP